MSKERDLLNRAAVTLKVRGICPLLMAEIQEFLAQLEQEDIYQRLLRVEEGIEVEILPSELWQDGYEAGKRSVLLSKQPEQHGTQYLLDQVARLTAENAMLKEKWSTSKQPEQEPVAWMSINNNGGISIDNYYANHKDYVPLYLAPPTREPLSEKEIAKNTPKLIHIGERLAFHAGVWFAEKYHGIGGGE